MVNFTCEQPKDEEILLLRERQSPEDLNYSQVNSDRNKNSSEHIYSLSWFTKCFHLHGLTWPLEHHLEIMKGDYLYTIFREMEAQKSEVNFHGTYG